MGRAATRSLPFRNWPEVDRVLWESLTRRAGPFDPEGALSQLRPASLETVRHGYGSFLKHASDVGVDLQLVAPPERARLNVLRSYVASLHGLSTRTKFGYFSALQKVLACGYPDRDWRDLQSATRNFAYLAQHSETTRHKFAVLHTPDLIRLAGALEAASAKCNDSQLQAEAVRDSLMILLLAHYPLRLKNFARLEIGVSIIAQGDVFNIALPGSEMKAHRPLSLTLSTEVSTKVHQYIANVRPLFPGGENRTSGRLWLRFTYGVWEKAAIGHHISRLTERGLGIRITPHLFRHAAANTIADTAGADGRIIRPLLGHVSDATAQRYYILADQINASRQYQRVVRETVKRGWSCES